MTAIILLTWLMSGWTACQCCLSRCRDSLIVETATGHIRLVICAVVAAMRVVNMLSGGDVSFMQIGCDLR